MSAPPPPPFLPTYLKIPLNSGNFVSLSAWTALAHFCLKATTRSAIPTFVGTVLNI